MIGLAVDMVRKSGQVEADAVMDRCFSAAVKVLCRVQDLCPGLVQSSLVWSRARSIEWIVYLVIRFCS